MLYWICPECGHECSPAIRECPTCTEADSGAGSPPVQEQILSLAQNFQSGPSVGLLGAAPQPNLLTASHGREGQSRTAAATATVQEPAELVESSINSLVKPLVESAQPKEPELSGKLAPLEGPPAKPVPSTRAKWERPGLLPIPSRIGQPALLASAPMRTEFRLQAAELAPTGEVVFEAARATRPTALSDSTEPLPSRRRTVAFMRAEMPAADHGVLALADLALMNQGWLTPAASGEYGQGVDVTEASAIPRENRRGQPVFGISRLEPEGEALTDLLHALKLTDEEIEQAAIRSIVESFHKQSAASLLPAPEEIITPPAPPTEQWKRSPKPHFAASAPGNAGLTAIVAGPQTPTLAGPCLPPQLRNFIENRTANVRPHRKRSAAPTWMISVLVAIVLFLGAGRLLQYVTADRDSKSVSAAVTQPQPSQPVPPVPLKVVQEHPAARFVEVAGVRVITGANKKLQLQYVVVNHSGNDISGLNIRIAGRAADSQSETPLFSISSVIASLAPYQSKEVRTDLDPSVKASSIPDWRSLRTEILIAKQ
jgi:hypothetical protein